MQMISFIFFGFVMLLFLAIYLVNRIEKNEEKSNVIVNTILVIASYIFVFYADWRFALVLAGITIVSWMAAKIRNIVK